MLDRTILGGIGIGDAQFGQDLEFLGLHLLGLGVVLVIAAQQVQHAVDDQMAQMIRQGLGKTGPGSVPPNVQAAKFTPSSTSI